MGLLSTPVSPRASLEQCRRTTYKENLSVSLPPHLRSNPDVANRSGAWYPRRHYEAGEPVIRRESEFPPRRVILHRLEQIEGVVRFSLRSQLLPFYRRTTVERTFRDADQSGLKCFFTHLNQGAENQPSLVRMTEALLLPYETQNDPPRNSL